MGVVTGALKSKIDRVWDAFWSGGISNPLEVIEQITYLLFLRRLDELQTLKDNKRALVGGPMVDPIFLHELALEMGKTVRELTTGEPGMSAHELSVEWPAFFEVRAEMRREAEEKEGS